MASETIANGSNEIIHKLDLNEYGLRDVPSEQKLKAKREVASYLENKILRDVSNSVSPVQGEGRFKRLDKDYAKDEKGGVRLANLENEGDLLNDFRVKNVETSFLDVGHRGNEVPKADGHNQLSSKAKTWAASKPKRYPRRRYIPDDNQKFTSPIVSEIRSIISEFVPAPSTERVEPEIDSVIETPTASAVTTDTLFSDDVIDSLLSDALARRQGQ